MRVTIYSILSLLLFSAVAASHSSFEHSHARRSLTKRQLPGALGDIADTILGGRPNPGDGEGDEDDGNDKPTGGDGSSSTSTTTSASETASETSTSTTTTTTTNTADENTSTSTTTTTTTTTPSGSEETPPPSSDTTSSSTTSPGPLDPVTSLVGGIVTSILPPTSVTPTETPTETASPTGSPTETNSPTETPTESTSPTSTETGTQEPPVETNTGTPTATETNDGGSTSPTPTPPPTTPPPETPTDTSSTSSSGGIIDTLTSILNPPKPTDTETDTTPGPTGPTNTDTSVTPGPTGPTDTSVTPGPTGPTDTDTSVTPGPTGPTDTSVTPGPTGPTDTDTSVTPRPTGPTDTDTSVTPGPTGPTDTDTSVTPGPTGPTDTDTSVTPGPTGTESDSSVISFPSGTESGTATVTGEESSVTTTEAPTTTVEVDPGLTFILTATSLAVATDLSSTDTAQTFTDPDQATTTVESVAPAATNALADTPLPIGMPSRIYPRDRLTDTTSLAGYSLISILFNRDLNWPFVVNNELSSSQIFGYTPVIIATALDIPRENVLTYALQVYVPVTYQSASDQNELGTIWLGYVPEDLVDTLAAQMKARNSKFYTGVSDPTAKDLAQRVNTGFSLLSVSPSQGSGGNGGNSGGGTLGTTGAASDGKSRQDAIIGVVSALGAIAVFVLVFLLYRTMKRRRELAHRRLSDPPEMMGFRPDGQEFDRDSVGGQRRRSFYYAEDSLRGYSGGGQQAVQDDMSYDHRTQGGVAQMRSRNVVPNAISAPILRESSMNW